MKYPNKCHLYLKEKELKERRQETLHTSFIKNMCSWLLTGLLFKTKQTWDLGAKERKQLNGQTKQKKRYMAKILWWNLNSVSWNILCKEFQLKRFRSLLSYSRAHNFVRSKPVSWKTYSGGYLADFSPCVPYSMSGVLAGKFKIATKSVAESETDGTLQICLNFLISAITNVFCSVTLCTQTGFEHMKTWLSLSSSSQKLQKCPGGDVMGEFKKQALWNVCFPAVLSKRGKSEIGMFLKLPGSTVELST